MKFSAGNKPELQGERRGRQFWARHTFLNVPSYGELPPEMQVDTIVQFDAGLDTNDIARDLEVHESRVYNHLSRVRDVLHYKKQAQARS